MPSHSTCQKTPFNINSLMYTYNSTSLLKNSSSRSCNTSGVTTPSIIDCKTIIPPHLSSRKIKKKQPKKVVLGKPYVGKQKMSSEALKELSRQATLQLSSSTTLDNSLQHLNHRNHHRMPSTDILSISRNLRNNLSKAKSKLMSTLKHSDIPEDIHMYNSLYHSTYSSLLKQSSSLLPSSSSSSFSFNHNTTSSSSSSSSVSSRCSDEVSSSSFVHLKLVTDENGAVSIVSNNKLSPMCTTDYSSDDDTTVLTESCSYLFGESLLKQDYIPPQQEDLVIDNMNILLQSWKLENPSSLLSKNELQDVTEDQIDSWLQRGGGGGAHMVMATDQELADLLDFDV